MKLFPSAEVMHEATTRHITVEMSINRWNDETEFQLWRARQFGEKRVQGTIAGIMELHCLVIDFNRGRLS
jgi:hypothetical protein